MERGDSKPSVSIIKTNFGDESELPEAKTGKCVFDVFNGKYVEVVGSNDAFGVGTSSSRSA